LTNEETKEELEWFLNGQPEHPELGLWATIHKETNQFIGRCGLVPWTVDERRSGSGLSVGQSQLAPGLETEVAQAIARYGFSVLDDRC
jgi:RimJ/RimL family protein N-acetyltransferase